MAIRKYTNPRELDVSRGLQEVLRRNGIQAHVGVKADGSFELIVLGHDSPVLRYDVSEKQVKNLMNWGTNYANKTAYNTFTAIVRNDFDMPDNFVSARNVNSRVVTGLHGYRIGCGEYGWHHSMGGIPFFRPFGSRTRGWGGDFLGWTPRQQPGWHMRRIDGRLFMHDAPFVLERPDGRMKPGEMRSGGYGFYYKGQQAAASQDALDSPVLDFKLKPLESAPRPTGQAVPYKEAITSDIYFTTDKWIEVLKSHGIVVDTGKKTLTMQSAATKVDLKYDLTDDEVKKIVAAHTSGKGGVSIDDRLDAINNVIGQDFRDKVTKEMLNTKELVNVGLKPDVREEVEAAFIKREEQLRQQEERMARQREYREAAAQENLRLRAVSDSIARDPQAVNGREIHEILGRYGFFIPGAHGRRLVVGEIRVDETESGNHIMTAEINGEKVSRSITKGQYDKFLQLDDKHRLRLFDDVFKCVAIKRDNGARDMSAPDITRQKDIETGEYMTREKADIEHSKANHVNGETLSEMNDSKGFYREIKGGREVEVGEVRVDHLAEGKYKMSAVIDGVEISHEISQKQYDKFLAVDDMQRLRLFAKVFPEVDIKTRPGMGTNIGAAILAGLVAATEVAHSLTHPIEGVHPPHEDISRMPSPTIYMKPNVVSPGEVLQHNYNEQMDMAFGHSPSGMGRGL